MASIDVNAITASLKTFIRSHRTEFQKLSARQSQLLEIGALAIAAKHYELSGYTVRAHNLIRGEFRVKTSARGHPWNFSWFEARRADQTFEIHGNLPVEDAVATVGARYVVDVAIAKGGRLPSDTRSRKTWEALENGGLVTFMEAKALVIYPMLIAQFVGIVHEIKPRFLLGKRPRYFLVEDHFDPSLVSLGYLHGTCANIVNAFGTRRLRIKIVPHFDTEIARLRGGSGTSPLAR